MDQKFKVVNIVLNGKISSPGWMLKLENLLKTIQDGKHRTSENYSLDRMELDKHLTFDLLVNNQDEIISFAGLLNGGRYPDGIYRVLNRTWVAEEYRVNHASFPFLTSRFILSEQIARHRPQLKLIFVSRERLAGRLFLKRWCRQQPRDEEWQLSQKLIQVVPEVEKKSCYQYICFRNLCGVEWTPKSVTPEQWQLLDL